MWMIIDSPFHVVIVSKMHTCLSNILYTEDDTSLKQKKIMALYLNRTITFILDYNCKKI